MPAEIVSLEDVKKLIFEKIHAAAGRLVVSLQADIRTRARREGFLDGLKVAAVFAGATQAEIRKAVAAGSLAMLEPNVKLPEGG